MRDDMQSLQSFSRSTTIHGWYQVFVGVEKEAGIARWVAWVSRVFWGVVLGFCLGFLIYYCSINIVQHYHYPTATTTSISTRRMPMPAITVFNVNELRFSRFTAKDVLHTGRYLLGINDNFTVILPQARLHYTDPQAAEILQKAGNAAALNGTDEANDFDAVEFVRRVGHQQQGMIARCDWNDGASGNTIDCLEYGNITRSSVYLFGNSYTINRNQKMIFKGASYYSGLRLDLQPEKEEYLPLIMRERGTYRKKERRGLFMVIHNPLISFFFGARWFYLNVKATNNYKVFLHGVRRIEHLPPPWGSCYDGPDAESYVDKDCIENCLSRILTERFGCILYDMASWTYKKTCISFNNNYTLSNTMRYNDRYVDMCKQECPIACTEWIYDVEFLEGRNLSHLLDGYINVMVASLDRLHYEIIKEIPFQDSTELLADLGGMAGLFLGASVISLLDLVLFVLGGVKKLTRTMYKTIYEFLGYD